MISGLRIPTELLAGEIDMSNDPVALSCTRATKGDGQSEGFDERMLGAPVVASSGNSCWCAETAESLSSDDFLSCRLFLLFAVLDAFLAVAVLFSFTH